MKHFGKGKGSAPKQPARGGSRCGKRTPCGAGASLSNLPGRFAVKHDGSSFKGKK